MARGKIIDPAEYRNTKWFRLWVLTWPIDSIELSKKHAEMHMC